MPNGGTVALSYGGDYSFGLTAAGFTGHLDFTGGSGSGAGLTINGTPYTLLYSMADLAGIDGSFSQYALATDLTATDELTAPLSAPSSAASPASAIPLAI